MLTRSRGCCHSLANSHRQLIDLCIHHHCTYYGLRLISNSVFEMGVSFISLGIEDLMERVAHGGWL